jgi:peroxiredoxin
MRLLGLVFCLYAGLCFAGPEPSPEMVFPDLEGIARRPLEPADKAASVLVFYWQDCPICNSYAPELNRIAASHTNFAFYIVQVDPQLTTALAREHAQAFNLHLPVLLDPQHRLVNQVHATTTPEAVVMGKNGRILYRGRIDNGYPRLGKKRVVVTEHDLIDSLDAITAGKLSKAVETTPVGCLIQ